MALVLCSILTVRSQVIVDSFDAGPFSFTLDPGQDNGVITVDGDQSQIFGGRRGVDIGQEFNVNVSHSTLTVQSGTGFLDYNRQQNGGISLTYGAFVSVPMNADLTTGGNNRFALNVLAAPGSFQLGVQVSDNSFFGSHNVTVQLSGNGAGIYEIPFSSFGLVEFDKVAGIRLFMNPGAAPNNGPGNYRFDYLAAVPEPKASVAITGLLLLGFGLSRTRGSARVRKLSAGSF